MVLAAESKVKTPAELPPSGSRCRVTGAVSLGRPSHLGGQELVGPFTIKARTPSWGRTPAPASGSWGHRCY